MDNRQVVTDDFIKVTYGMEIKDYNGTKYLFAGVSGKKVLVQEYGNKGIDSIREEWPSVFKVRILN